MLNESERKRSFRHCFLLFFVWDFFPSLWFDLFCFLSLSLSLAIRCIVNHLGEGGETQKGTYRGEEKEEEEEGENIASGPLSPPIPEIHFYYPLPPLLRRRRRSSTH